MIGDKLLGLMGVAAYIAVASLALFAGYKYFFKIFFSRVTEKGVFWLTLATLLFLLLIFLAAYPTVNAGVVGPGDDTEDALNGGVGELLNGHYPYRAETYAGNPVGTMPGALLLAIPFVLLGNSAYQNFFWLFMFFLSMKSYLKDGRLTLLMLWVMLTLSPDVLRNLVTGDDKLANSVYVLLFIMWMVSNIPRPHHSSWIKLSSAILLGVALSSRANFVLLLPLVFSTLVQSAGWKPATKYTAVACVSFCAVTAPFYLYDPQGFGPRVTAEKLGQFQPLIPSTHIVIPLGIILPLLTAVIALMLSKESMSRNLPVLFRNCAIVQAFPVLCAVVLYSIMTEMVTMHYFQYGIFFLFFGAVASWTMLFRAQDDSIEKSQPRVVNSSEQSGTNLT